MCVFFVQSAEHLAFKIVRRRHSLGRRQNVPLLIREAVFIGMYHYQHDRISAMRRPIDNSEQIPADDVLKAAPEE